MSASPLDNDERFQNTVACTKFMMSMLASWRLDSSLDFLRKKSSMLGRSGRYASRRFETETWQFSFAEARMTEQVLFTNGRSF